MTRLIICRKLGKQLPGLASPPIPGPVGKDIYEHVSAEAWGRWQALQTMLINEHQLSMMDPESRAFLMNQMEKFFANEDYEQPEGYVSPGDSTDLT
jgi:Fe-S cluster biosynthesis and repair protein YggX